MKTAAVLIIFSLAAAAESAEKKGASVKKAIAVLHPAKDGKVAGSIVLERTPSGVTLTGAVTGLEPGKHGFHIHEFGDCSAADFTSAGAHFNPTGHPHGGPADAKRHVGDLGNIAARADGTATIEQTDKVLRLLGAHGVLGRAVIVHAKADDLKTQPTGDAGGRLACGVVGVAKAAQTPSP